MASLREFSPEAAALSQEVLQQAMRHGEPSNIDEPGLGREAVHQNSLVEGSVGVFVCFNGERTVPGVFRDPVTGIEHNIQIVAHINIISETAQTSTQPNRFYSLTTDGDVILSERWADPGKQSTSRLLKPAEITDLIETIARS